MLLGGLAWGACDTADPLAGGNDCDEDGYTLDEGDCDDDNELVSPGVDEVCLDGEDNDCDGFVDDGCDDDGFGSLRGGGVCGGSGGAALVLLPLLGWRSRR